MGGRNSERDEDASLMALMMGKRTWPRSARKAVLEAGGAKAADSPQECVGHQHDVANILAQ